MESGRVVAGVVTVSDGAGFRTVGRVGEIADGTGKAVEVDGRAVAVFRDGDAYYAIDDVCPHQEFPLHDGPVLDCTVTCLFHGWRFRLDDGGWVENPSVRVATHRVRVVGGEIRVALGGGDAA